MEPLKKGFVGKRRIIVTSPPPFAPPLQLAYYLPMEEADKRRRPCTKRFRLALWWLVSASTARKRGRGTGRISSLNGSGCSPNGRGGFGGIRSTAKFPTAGHLPIPTITIPGSIPNGRWRPGCRRNTGCYGRCCSQQLCLVA
jgi:hypothetical protein